MNVATLLIEVKNRLGITDNYHDTQLTGFINDVICYLKSAGVSDTILESESAYGCIFRGVADLWNNSPGDAVFSNLFRERAIQLMAQTAEES